MRNVPPMSMSLAACFATAVVLPVPAQLLRMMVSWVFDSECSAFLRTLYHRVVHIELSVGPLGLKQLRIPRESSPALQACGAIVRRPFVRVGEAATSCERAYKSWFTQVSSQCATRMVAAPPQARHNSLARIPHTFSTLLILPSLSDTFYTFNCGSGPKNGDETALE